MRKRYKIENWTECIWMKLCNYCTWRVAQWWKHSPPPMWSGINAICGLSLVLVLSFTLRGFCWVLQFSLLLKIKQHFQTPIWLRMLDKEHYMDVLRLNCYSFTYQFYSKAFLWVLLSSFCSLQKLTRPNSKMMWPQFFKRWIVQSTR